MNALRGTAAAAALGLALGAGPARAEAPERYDLAVDVPSRLGGTDYTTNQVARRAQDFTYALVATFPSDLSLSAVERRALNGAWLFSPTDPWTIGADTYLPNDVVSLFGGVYSSFLDGDAAGVPRDARIDAISETASGAIELSFDVPVRIETVEYGRSDLVRWDGGTVFSLAWSAAGHGVPDFVNLVGATRDLVGARLLTFDVPVQLQGVDYRPGDLVRWDAVSLQFTLASSDPDWPAGSELRDLTTTPGVGRVPESWSEGTPLTIDKVALGHIELRWGAACGAGPSTDYAVFEGTIGSWYSHMARYCSTNGQLTSSFVPPAGDWYYLVAARNGPSEGSLGVDFSGHERPQAPNACAPRTLAPCP